MIDRNEKELVRSFYNEIWNAHRLDAMRTILHEGVTFRGSLGLVRNGCSEFAEYVDMVHEALGDYECIIEELVTEEGKAFAKMTFTGIHRNEFLGYAPTGRRVSWAGCALFDIRDGHIADIWVLGDLANLEPQLRGDNA